jgi:hypothetical protein
MGNEVAKGILNESEKEILEGLLPEEGGIELAGVGGLGAIELGAGAGLVFKGEEIVDGIGLIISGGDDRKEGDGSRDGGFSGFGDDELKGDGFENYDPSNIDLSDFKGGFIPPPDISGDSNRNSQVEPGDDSGLRWRRPGGNILDLGDDLTDIDLSDETDALLPPATQPAPSQGGDPMGDDKKKAAAAAAALAASLAAAEAARRLAEGGDGIGNLPTGGGLEPNPPPDTPTPVPVGPINPPPHPDSKFNPDGFTPENVTVQNIRTMRRIEPDQVRKRDFETPTETAMDKRTIALFQDQRAEIYSKNKVTQMIQKDRIIKYNRPLKLIERNIGVVKPVADPKIKVEKYDRSLLYRDPMDIKPKRFLQYDPSQNYTKYDWKNDRENEFLAY